MLFSMEYINKEILCTVFFTFSMCYFFHFIFKGIVDIASSIVELLFSKIDYLIDFLIQKYKEKKTSH